MPARLRLLPVALVGAAVLVLLLVPRHVDLPISALSDSRLLGDAADGGRPLWWLLEDLANVAMFVPVGWVLARAVRPVPAALAGIALSAACELAQHWIPNRDGSMLDVSMNAAGTVLGVLIVLLQRRRYARRDAPQAGQDQKTRPAAVTASIMRVRHSEQFGTSRASSPEAAAGTIPASASLPTVPC